MNTPVIKISKTLRQHAAKRRTKTPAVLAQQAKLNGVLQGRKGGVHQAPTKAQKLAAARLKEAVLEP